MTQPRILVSTTSRTTTEIASTESNEVSSEATTTTTEESSSEEVSTSDDAPEANGASDDSSSDEEKDSEASRVLRERYTVFLGNMPFGKPSLCFVGSTLIATVFATVRLLLSMMLLA